MNNTTVQSLSKNNLIFRHRRVKVENRLNLSPDCNYAYSRKPRTFSFNAPLPENNGVDSKAAITLRSKLKVNCITKAVFAVNLDKAALNKFTSPAEWTLVIS